MNTRLIEKMLSGDKYALSKVITSVELGENCLQDIMKAAFGRESKAHIIGVTGPPGAGKSTLINAMVSKLVVNGKKAAIIAVDPNSPFSGGAVLGDRVRMNSLNLNENVFIRSISSRDSLGGLSVSTYQIVKVFEACGYDYIFVETVGIGQSEVSIMDIVDTVVLALAPGLGDYIQALKAGVLEIGDLLVVNKCDRDGAEKLATDLKDIAFDISTDWWSVPIIKTNALKTNGIDELIDKTRLHNKKKRENVDYEALNRKRIKLQLIRLFEKKFSGIVKENIETKDNLDEILGYILQGETSPYRIVDYNKYSILDENDNTLCHY